jgi:TonB family protein
MRFSSLAAYAAVLAVPPAAAQEVEDFGFPEYLPAAGSRPAMVVLNDIGDEGEVRWTCTPGGLRISVRLQRGGPAPDGRIQLEFDGDGREAVQTAGGDSTGFVLSGDAAAFSRQAWTSTWLVLFPWMASGDPYPVAFALGHVDEALNRLSCVPPVRDERGNLSWAKRATAATPAGVRAAQRRNMERVMGVAGGADFSGQGQTSTVERTEARLMAAADSAAGGPTRFINASAVPRFMRESYPRELRSERATGTTDLELTVAADGRVQETQVLRSSRGTFTRRSVRVAEQLRFNRAAEPVRTVRVQLRWHPDRGEAVIVGGEPGTPE